MATYSIFIRHAGFAEGSLDEVDAFFHGATDDLHISLGLSYGKVEANSEQEAIEVFCRQKGYDSAQSHMHGGRLVATLVSE